MKSKMKSNIICDKTAKGKEAIKEHPNHPSIIKLDLNT